MVQLSISVGLANILLWAFIEIFLLLLTNTATSLIAQHSINNRLLTKQSIQLNIPHTPLDTIPYNKDIFLTKPAVKLTLTVYRIIVVAVSVYIGASLDGERGLHHEAFETSSSIFLAPERGQLTDNSGDDLNAMSKFSCLRILDNNNLVLYKAFVNPLRDILCEDGESTPTKTVLLQAEIRATFRTGKTGKDMRHLQIYASKFENVAAEPGLQLSPYALVVNATNEAGSLTNIAARIVFMEQLSDNTCLFGLWRSPGLGFDSRVDIKLIASCKIQIAALERLLRPKPDFLPPRLAFFYQVVDSVVLERRETRAPRVRDKDIVAALPTSAIVVMFVFGGVSTALAAVFWVVVRGGKVGVNIADAKGVGMVLGGERGRVLFRWDPESGSVVCGVDDGRGRCGGVEADEGRQSEGFDGGYENIMYNV